MARRFNSLPPVTRYYALSIFLVTLGARLGAINLAHFALIWDFVLKKFQVRSWLLTRHSGDAFQRFVASMILDRPPRQLPAAGPCLPAPRMPALGP